MIGASLYWPSCMPRAKQASGGVGHETDTNVIMLEGFVDNAYPVGITAIRANL